MPSFGFHDRQCCTIGPPIKLHSKPQTNESGAEALTDSPPFVAGFFRTRTEQYGRKGVEA
jgi:hypothetical protein